jgi:nucleotide-binding universal stress UspA family protein
VVARYRPELTRVDDGRFRPRHGATLLTTASPGIGTQSPEESTVSIRFTSLPTPPAVGATQASIVVAVNGGSSGWKALDWATAEAAARGSALRVVHVIAPPTFVRDPLGSVSPTWIDPCSSQEGARVLHEAVQRARSVAPDVTVETCLESGSVATAIRDASRNSSLTVVGRGRPRRFGLPSPAWRIARRAESPVAVVELDEERRDGPSAGRVVLGIEGTPASAAAIVYAFQAAARRGIGLTVIHACNPWAGLLESQGESRASMEELHLLVAIEDFLEICRDAYPEVDFRRRFVSAQAGATLIAESGAAALLVVGASPRRGRRRAPLGPVARTACRAAHSPVAIIRPTTLRHRVGMKR